MSVGCGRHNTATAAASATISPAAAADYRTLRLPAPAINYSRRFCAGPSIGNNAFAAIPPGSMTMVAFPTILTGPHLWKFYIALAASRSRVEKAQIGGSPTQNSLQ
jgi:hypothetical protein